MLDTDKEIDPSLFKNILEKLVETNPVMKKSLNTVIETRIIRNFY